MRTRIEGEDVMMIVIEIEEVDDDRRRDRDRRDRDRRDRDQ